MRGAVRLAPTHEREYLKRLGYVCEYHDDEASRTEHKSRVAVQHPLQNGRRTFIGILARRPL